MLPKNAIVIGAGIVGLATARSLAERGYKVLVFERNQRAVSASIRNFGMIWPVGQPNGKLYERALKSKAMLQQVCGGAGLWCEEAGSLHLAYNDLELEVIREFAEANVGSRPVKVLTPAETLARSHAVNPHGLKGALWSADEMIVEPRVAIAKLPAYLANKYGVEFYFNTAITEINYPFVISGNKTWNAEEIFVCSGAEFETLYPKVFEQHYFTKCKLQMMRIVAQPDGWRIGPSLCGGLSLTHYKSFEVAPGVKALRQYYQDNMPEYVKWGIHVMVSQNAEGELTIGDSHEYGLVHDPFDRQYVNKLITDYLKGFALFQHWELAQSWNGIYPKKTDGGTEFVFAPEEGVKIINGLGGAGMTLAFGLAEEVVNNEY